MPFRTARTLGSHKAVENDALRRRQNALRSPIGRQVVEEQSQNLYETITKEQMRLAREFAREQERILRKYIGENGFVPDNDGYFTLSSANGDMKVPRSMLRKAFYDGSVKTIERIAAESGFDVETIVNTIFPQNFSQNIKNLIIETPSLVGVKVLVKKALVKFGVTPKNEDPRYVVATFNHETKMNTDNYRNIENRIIRVDGAVARQVEEAIEFQNFSVLENAGIAEIIPVEYEVLPVFDENSRMVRDVGVARNRDRSIVLSGAGLFYISALKNNQSTSSARGTKAKMLKYGSKELEGLGKYVENSQASFMAHRKYDAASLAKILAALVGGGVIPSDPSEKKQVKRLNKEVLRYYQISPESTAAGLVPKSDMYKNFVMKDTDMPLSRPEVIRAYLRGEKPGIKFGEGKTIYNQASSSVFRVKGDPTAPYLPASEFAPGTHISSRNFECKRVGDISQGYRVHVNPKTGAVSCGPGSLSRSLRRPDIAQDFLRLDRDIQDRLMDGAGSTSMYNNPITMEKLKEQAKYRKQARLKNDIENQGVLTEAQNRMGHLARGRPVEERLLRRAGEEQLYQEIIDGRFNLDPPMEVPREQLVVFGNSRALQK